MKNPFPSGPRWQSLLLASTAVLIGVTGVAHSQPGGNQMQGGQGVQGGWNNRQGQNGQNRAQMREQQLRQTLNTAGYTDKTLQDTVVAFSTAQEQSKQTLRQSLNQLRQTASAQETTDAQAATALAQFRSQVANAKDQWATDVKTLDNMIGFSKKPKLEALLTAMGLVGEEASFIGGNGPGGMGGRGNGRGGGMGGFGGMGGGMDGDMNGGFGGPGGPPPDGNF